MNRLGLPWGAGKLEMEGYLLRQGGWSRRVDVFSPPPRSRGTAGAPGHREAQQYKCYLGDWEASELSRALEATRGMQVRNCRMDEYTSSDHKYWFTCDGPFRAALGRGAGLECYFVFKFGLANFSPRRCKDARVPRSKNHSWIGGQH